jgi:HPt (histidine-containing phosphotransfer) domain-containing protein
MPESAPVLDAAIVGELQALARAGNPQLLFKLQASFARDTPERLRALRAAIVSGDPEAVAFSLHTLRGSAANLGATGIVDVCRRLELAPAPLELSAVEPELEELERCATAAAAELAQLAEAG